MGVLYKSIFFKKPNFNYCLFCSENLPSGKNQYCISHSFLNNKLLNSFQPLFRMLNYFKKKDIRFNKRNYTQYHLHTPSIFLAHYKLLIIFVKLKMNCRQNKSFRFNSHNFSFWPLFEIWLYWKIWDYFI